MQYLDAGGDEETAGVWPGDLLVLPPPARHDDGDIEAEDKGDWDEVSKPLAVQTQLLKFLLTKVSMYNQDKYIFKTTYNKT